MTKKESERNREQKAEGALPQLHIHNLGYATEGKCSCGKRFGYSGPGSDEQRADIVKEMFEQHVILDHTSNQNIA